MSSEKLVEFSVDSEKVFRICDKVMALLQKKCRNVSEGYVVLCFLSLFFEIHYGCSLRSGEKDVMRKLISEHLEDVV